MEVVVTTGATRRAKLQSNCHHQQTNTQLFTGRMSFLSPNQQCQSTEGKISHSMDLLTPSSPGGLPILSLTTNSSWSPWGRVAMPLISPLMPVPTSSALKKIKRSFCVCANIMYKECIIVNAFSALTLLAGWQDRHLASKSLTSTIPWRVFGRLIRNDLRKTDQLNTKPKQAGGGRPPWYAPAQVCKWWHDIRHVRIRIGHHYCMSMLACQYNQPKQPGDFDLLTLKVVSESRVTWATSVPILVFLGLSVLDLGLMYATDRQTDIRQHHRLMPLVGGIKC